MAKVRSIKDADGNVLDQVPPGYPGEIEGWRDMPAAGEIVLEAESERHAKQVIKVRLHSHMFLLSTSVVIVQVREDELERLQQEQDLKVIKQKQIAHQQEYKEQLEKKRQMGRFRMKPRGPRPKEYTEGRSINLFCILYFYIKKIFYYYFR